MTSRGRFDGVFLHLGHSADTGDQGHRGFDSGGSELLAGLRRLRGGDALFDLSQNPGRFPVLGPEVDHLEAVLAQRAKLLMGFAQHIERTAVGRDPAAGGKELKNPVEDGEKVGSFDDQRVAIREEDLAVG